MLSAAGKEIPFADGKGQKKPELQQLHEELEAYRRRLMENKNCFEIMGKDRNSYSRTDLGATFMRMKEDHIVKPANSGRHQQHIILSTRTETAAESHLQVTIPPLMQCVYSKYNTLMKETPQMGLMKS